MKIVSISGLDGSGKSTQIQLLKNYLESQGKRVFYFHAIQFSIANRFKKSSGNGQKSVTKSSVFGIWLRKLALKADIFRFKKLVSKLEKEGFDYILTDRYFYDSILNIEYLSLPKAKPSDSRRFRLRIVKPDIAIYLQTDPEIIMQRERKPDQGIEYLKKKKEIYDRCAIEWGFKIIDGNKSKEDVFESIKNVK